MPAMNPASGADGSDISHERSDLGDHEVVTIGLLDLRSLKFTHTKQRGAIHPDSLHAGFACLHLKRDAFGACIVGFSSDNVFDLFIS